MATQPLTSDGYIYKEGRMKAFYNNVRSPEGAKLHLLTGKKFSQDICNTFKGEKTRLIQISIASRFPSVADQTTTTGSLRNFFSTTLNKFAKTHQISNVFAEAYGAFKEKECEKNPGQDVIATLDRIRETLQKDESQAIFAKVALMAKALGEDYSDPTFLKSIDNIFLLDRVGATNSETQLNEIAANMLLNKIAAVETAIINKKSAKGANVDSSLLPETLKPHVETLNELIAKYNNKEQMNFPEGFERLKQAVTRTAEENKIAQFRGGRSQFVNTPPPSVRPLPAAKSAPAAVSALAQQVRAMPARPQPAASKAPARPPRPQPVLPKAPAVPVAQFPGSRLPFGGIQK